MRTTLARVNIAVYLLYFLFAWFTRYFEIINGRYLESFLLVLIIFVLGGLNITSILQVFVGKIFSRMEFVNIAAAAAFVVVPLINLVEISFFGSYNRVIVLANSAVFYVLAVIICKFVAVSNSKKICNPVFEIRTSDKKNLLFFGLIILIYSAVVGVIVTAYYALPDFDPYYWMSRTQACIAGGINSNCFSDRSLYEGLNLLFSHATEIDIYAYFKYVVPFFSLIIALPAFLVASAAKTISGKLTIALLPLAVPSTLLYLYTPMPQAAAIILSFYFLYWLFYSRAQSNDLFFYLAGAVSFLIFWYHEVGIFFFMIWLIVAIMKDGKRMLAFLRYHKFFMIFIFFLLLSNIAYIRKPYDFASFWVNNLVSSVRIAPNLRFPASYINIDGNNMGWSGGMGVAKYYLFYVGPLLLVVFIFSLYRVLKSRDEFIDKIKKRTFSKESAVLVLAFIFFFVFAEILPRLFSFAFLPERVWIFAGISAFFLLGTFGADWERSAPVRRIFLVSIVIGVMGAVYINHQKGFALPNYRLDAAKWIQKNLPSDRIILSVGDKNLIRYYAQSRYYLMPEGFYCDKNVTGGVAVWDYFTRGNVPYLPTKETVEKSFRNELSEYLNKKEPPTISSVQAIVGKYAVLAGYGDKGLGREDLISSTYIYYYKDDPRNPYSDRPYYKKPLDCDKTVFESYPDSFQLVYDNNEMVKIWKIIK